MPKNKKRKRNPPLPRRLPGDVSRKMAHYDDPADRKRARDQRRVEALDMKLRGFSFRQIAKVHGVAPSTSANDVKTILEESKEYAVKGMANMREFARQRYESLIMALQPGLLADDMEIRAKVVHAIVHVQRSIDKLLGLNAPTHSKVDVNVATGVLVVPETSTLENWEQMADNHYAEKLREQEGREILQ